MAPNVLIVLTSHDQIPGKGPTGWFLPEFAHPYDVISKKANVTVASPKGGVAPLDQGSVKMFEADPSSQNFLKNHESLWTNTVKLSDVASRVNEFDAIFYVGGHGPMFDLAVDPVSLKLIQDFAVAKKPVAAVCHGPCVFVNATTPTGESLLAGAEVTGFSNLEEDQVQLSSFMPFMLETELEKKAGKYVKADEPWGPKVVVSKVTGLGGALITGQNPASATGVGEAIVAALGL